MDSANENEASKIANRYFEPRTSGFFGAQYGNEQIVRFCLSLQSILSSLQSDQSNATKTDLFAVSSFYV